MISWTMTYPKRLRWHSELGGKVHATSVAREKISEGMGRICKAIKWPFILLFDLPDPPHPHSVTIPDTRNE